MARGIDHIVHAVRDLDAAAALYRGMGFTVGARNKHPWGTHNYIVQFPGSFIELLTVAEPELVPEHATGHFSFGAFNRDFLAQTQGLSMLVLEGQGAADVAEFEKAGIADGKPFGFEREARRPDNTTIKVAFTLAFARDPAAPQVGFFTCQQHYPENFWNPAFQKHANSVVGRCRRRHRNGCAGGASQIHRKLRGRVCHINGRRVSRSRPRGAPLIWSRRTPSPAAMALPRRTRNRARGLPLSGLLPRTRASCNRRRSLPASPAFMPGIPP